MIYKYTNKVCHNQLSRPLTNADNENNDNLQKVNHLSTKMISKWKYYICSQLYRLMLLVLHKLYQNI